MDTPHDNVWDEEGQCPLGYDQSGIAFFLIAVVIENSPPIVGLDSEDGHYPTVSKAVPKGSIKFERPIPGANSQSLPPVSKSCRFIGSSKEARGNVERP